MTSSVNTLITDVVTLYEEATSKNISVNAKSTINDVSTIASLILGLVESKVSFNVEGAIEALDDIINGGIKIVSLVKNSETKTATSTTATVAPAVIVNK